MYRTIMTPVDLAHVERLQKALQTAGDMAKQYGAPLVFVGVTSPQPGAVARTPKEFEAKLEAFAAAQGKIHGVATSAHVIVDNDPTIDMEAALLKAVDATGADLVVMASHVPGLADHLWPSNGGGVAAHGKTSVFIVRET